MFSEDQNKKEDIHSPAAEGSSGENDISTSNEREMLQEQAAQWRDKYLHLNADFQNYKRRQEKERGLWMHGAQAQILKELLSIVGDFDRALAQSTTAGAEEHWRQGFEMIRASLYKLLAKFDVVEITQNTEFNPEIHEAIAMIESPSHPSGSIVDVVEKGFMFKDQVLRPAKVTVAQ
jgi:molecular chaperone GrpE